MIDILAEIGKSRMGSVTARMRNLVLDIGELKSLKILLTCFIMVSLLKANSNLLIFTF